MTLSLMKDNDKDIQSYERQKTLKSYKVKKTEDIKAFEI